MFRGRRTLFSWIAVLAILLNALAPAASQALMPSRGTAVLQSQWLEVCATQGATWVRLAPDGSVIAQTSQKPADAPITSHEAHCPYCVTHAASFALPPGPVAAMPAWELAFDLSPLRALFARTPVHWLSPSARAPPYPIG